MMPRMRLYLGCGEPPSAETRNPDERLLWSWDRDAERRMSPFERHESGLLPYPNFGVGEMRADFEWCPRWWLEFDETTIGGESALIALRRAQRWTEKGSLGDLLGSAPTSCAVAGIDLLDALDAQRQRDDIESARAARERHGSR